MNHKIVIRLPKPYKVGPITFTRKVKVGLCFDTLALYHFQRNTATNTAEQIRKWRELNGLGVFLIEQWWAAAESFASLSMKKVPMTKEQFCMGISTLDEATRIKVVECQRFSEVFAAPKKKAVKAPR